MNARNLKKRSATDWARVDQMTEDEIDTSDIPPLDDAFFVGARWRLPRLYIYRLDFRQALDYAAHILDKKFHDERKTESRRLVHRALNTSLIISYSRPFHRNKDLEDKYELSLEKSIAQVLTEAETELHRKVFDSRNTAYAHSDARSHLPKSFDYDKSPVIMYRIENLNKSETATLKTMIKKWIKHLEEKISKDR
ncbi:MAG: hypothetical protein ABI923_09335 [bacterium]